MRNTKFIGIFLLFFLVACAGHRAAEQPIDALPTDTVQKTDESTAANNKADDAYVYILGPGDEISVNVWRNDDLKRTVKVDPLGFVYLPLAGEIKGAGMTISELRKEITSRLSKFLVNPQVDINLTSQRSQKLHIFGEVKTPGTFTFENQITIWEGILKAGGFTDDANTKNILIARVEDDVVKINAVSLNMKKMFADGQVRERIYLKNGDTIYAPEKKIASFERFMIRMKNIIDPLYTLERGIVLGPEAEAVLRGVDDSNNIIISN